MPITTSGKIARRWCKRAYDQHTYQTLYEWRADPTDINGTNGPSGGGNGGNGGNGGSSGTGAGGAGDGAGGDHGHPEEAVDVAAWSDDALLASLVADVAAATHLDTDAPLDLDTALVNLGADSLGLAQVAEVLRRKYSCPVPDQWLYFDTTTARQVGAQSPPPPFFLLKHDPFSPDPCSS